MCVPKTWFPVLLPPFPIHTPSALEHHPHTGLLRPPTHPSPPSSTPSIATVLHHARAPTKTTSSTARDGHFSSTATDQEPRIASSRFIGAVVLFVGAAHTTFSSTATRLIPRCTRLPSQICFNATDSHRTPNAYTAPQERWYFISPQLFDLNQKIDLNLVTLLSFQLLEFSS